LWRGKCREPLGEKEGGGGRRPGGRGGGVQGRKSKDKREISSKGERLPKRASRGGEIQKFNKNFKTMGGRKDKTVTSYIKSKKGG